MIQYILAAIGGYLIGDSINKYAKGGEFKGSTVKGKDFSGNYYSTNDFVGANKLEKQAEKILGKGWEAEDDVNQIESIINSLGSKYVVTVPEDRSQWNEMREKYDLANTTNDSNYDIFVITKFTKTFTYANGGELEGIGSKKSFGQLDFDQLEDIFNVQLFGIEEDETEKLLDELREEWLEMTEEQRGEILDKYDIEYAKGGVMAYAKGGGVRRFEKNKNN